MRRNPVFISTDPAHIKHRYIQRSHLFRGPDGAILQFSGKQVISIARIVPHETEALSATFVRSILQQAGHEPSIVDARHGFRSTGPSQGGPAVDAADRPKKEAAVRIAFSTETATQAALTFLRASLLFDCKITLCLAPKSIQVVISHLRTFSRCFHFVH